MIVAGAAGASAVMVTVADSCSVGLPSARGALEASATGRCGAAASAAAGARAGPGGTARDDGATPSTCGAWRDAAARCSSSWATTTSRSRSACFAAGPCPPALPSNGSTTTAGGAAYG